MGEKTWAVQPPDAAATELARAANCPQPIADLLWTRGIRTEPEAHRFFEPTLDDLHDPFLLKGMAAAVDRIVRAVQAGEPILIYGDYDVDGTTATVLLKTAIERLAPPGRPAQVSYHVPHRLREGYGMQGTRLAQAAQDGIRLVVSVDTGIRAFAAAEEAKTLGLDLIVTDHHLPDGAVGVPQAVAVVNPAQPGCPYPDKHLCGAAVAFKLAHALLLRHAAGDEPALLRLRERMLPSLLKLTSLATIADSVPLTGENRAIVWLGLRALANPVQVGLRALMEVAGLRLDAAPSASEVGFRLAPRINAAGRMDVASDVVELFLTRDPDRARVLAAKLEELNEARRATEATALEMIERQLATLRGNEGFTPQCFVLDHPEWHRGVLGILASRVVDRTGLPALVLSSAGEDAHGSGRSVAGFHLLDALTAVHEPAIFHRFGGHAHAVGFSLPAAALPALRERMAAHTALHLARSGEQAHVCDLDLRREELTGELAAWLERCAPFGPGHAEPLLLVRDVVVSAAPRIVQERHVCLSLGTSTDGLAVSAMGWSRAGGTPWTERLGDAAMGTRLDLIAHLRHNRKPRFAGLELVLVAARPARTREAAEKSASLPASARLID